MSHKPPDDTEEEVDHSPECLLTSEPVKDPYSTDEENDSCRKLRRGCRETEISHKESPSLRENKVEDVSLSAKVNSSELRAEQVHFYCNIDLKAIDEEIVLVDKSVDECLLELFKFAPGDNFDNKEKVGTWRGKTMREIKQNTPFFSWFQEHDDINWKTASDKEKEMKQILYGTMMCDSENHSPDFHRLVVAETAMHLYDEIIEEKVRFSSRNDRMKRHHKLTSFMESVATCVAPCNYIKNGKCVEEFDLYVPHHLVSDSSPLLQHGRKVLITTRPDGVFTCNKISNSGVFYKKIWVVAVEVYGPSSPNVIERQKISPTPMLPAFGISPIRPGQGTSPKLKSPGSDQHKVVYERDTLKPRKSVNKLDDPMYVEDVRAYINNSIPLQCRRFCTNKLAGKHVMQLLSLAKSSFKTEVKDDVGVLGIFMVNEYVYFSRLDITKKMFNFLEYDRFYASNEPLDIKYFTHEYKALEPPIVSYSNFRLDATVSSNRLALLIFLDQYIQAAHKKG